MTEEQDKLIKEVINQHSKTLKQLADAVSNLTNKIKDIESSIKAICYKIDNSNKGSKDDIMNNFMDILNGGKK